MTTDTEAAKRHHDREAIAANLSRIGLEMAQSLGAEPRVLVEAMVLATAMTSIDLAKEGMRREAVVGSAEMMLEFSRSDAPWFSGEPRKEH